MMTDINNAATEETEICVLTKCPVLGTTVQKAQGQNSKSLQKGIADLDNILTRLTDLCKQSVSTFKANVSICDEVSCTKDNEEEIGICKKPTCPQAPTKPKLCTTGICLSPECYSAYMGYRFDAPELSPCGGATCQFKEPLNLCSGATCCMSSSAKSKNPFSEFESNRNEPCGSPTCPFSTERSKTKRTSLFPPVRDFNFLNKYQFDIPIPKPIALTDSADPCGGVVCSTNTKDPKQQTAVGLCGRTSCPYASEEYAKEPSLEQKKDVCDEPTCPVNQNIVPVGLCGRTSCPFASVEYTKKLNLDQPKKDAAVCDEPTCPFASTDGAKQNVVPVGLCGRTSCPFASVDYAKKSVPKVTAPCGNETCPYGTVVEAIPIPPPPAPGLVPCPYAGRVKRYPCGSPSCPYINPSGMIYTHHYGEDYSYVQESARPYSGSACPYDHLSSLDKTYPCPYASNYQTFDKADICGSPDCPFMYNKTKTFSRPKPSTDSTLDQAETCGSPDCQYVFVKPKKPKENSVCDNATCPYKGEGSEILVNNIELSSSVDKNQKLQPCPFGKKLSICDECGGVFSEKDPNASDHKEIMTTAIAVVSGEIRRKSIESEQNVEEKTDQSTENTSEGQMDEADEWEDDELSKERIESVPKVPSLVKDVVEEKKPSDMLQKKTVKKKKKLEKISLYSYPGVQIGHRECNMLGPLIPSNMGWLWNIKPQGNAELWRGYKPGAVSRTVDKIIKAHRRALGILDTLDGAKKRKSRTKLKIEDLKHCVEVKKKAGDITITVNPLKDPKKLEPYENPFMDVTPMQFKVEKEKKQKAKKEQSNCECDDSSSTPVESSDSELEFHFSPPAARPIQRVKKQKHMKTAEVQYNMYDLAPEFRVGRGKKGKGKKGGKKGGKKKGKKK